MTTVTGFEDELRRVYRRQPVSRVYSSNCLSRYFMDWYYYMRLVIHVTPRRILWWPGEISCGRRSRWRRMMWDEMKKNLPDFDSAVLAGLEAGGYPFSVRCWPYPDYTGAEVLRVQLLVGTPIQPSSASLLCHSHDENLWKLLSFLVRGVLSKDERGWSFEPGKFITGAGIGGLPAMIRFFTSSRRNAARYLKKRGLARPSIPWDEINAVKRRL